MILRHVHKPIAVCLRCKPANKDLLTDWQSCSSVLEGYPHLSSGPRHNDVPTSRVQRRSESAYDVFKITVMLVPCCCHVGAMLLHVTDKTNSVTPQADRLNAP